MKNAPRGEAHFRNLPSLAAILYDRLMHGEMVDRHYAEIAAEVVSRCKQGSILDVGTGPGRLLIEIARLAPALELHGLDISQAMVKRAHANLGDVKAELRVGGIRHTDYPADFFDGIVCSGSFYLWDHPVESLDEIRRILKPGASAYLYESYSDFDEEAFGKALAKNQSRLSWLRRRIGGHFLRRQLRMTYSTEDVERIISGTGFSATSSVERIELVGLPSWLRITLRK